MPSKLQNFNQLMQYIINEEETFRKRMKALS
ncbi:hypothetical protein ABID49_002303 [Bhargavaea ullalensis]|uniref:Uncharacterized protein n=1 Tax=Bhargavaea ullalensis TaxID=1265685 RepID=A0ABV2GDK5_9BACL